MLPYAEKCLFREAFLIGCLISINRCNVGSSSENSYLSITCDGVHSMLCVCNIPHSLSSVLSLFFLLGHHRPPLCFLRRPSKVKVRDLEQKCRSQSEHFHQLSNELLNFRLQSDTVDVLKINPASTSQIPLSSEKKLSQVIGGFEAWTETGGSVRHTHLFFYFLHFLKFVIIIR